MWPQGGDCVTVAGETGEYDRRALFSLSRGGCKPSHQPGVQLQLPQLATATTKFTKNAVKNDGEAMHSIMGPLREKKARGQM